VVVGASGGNFLGAIDLLGQDKSDELMRKDEL
jgi:hypothetical protein